ncbi:MAG TPA: hypothetical protein VK607_18540 [Kofleriaceae bacterium]|nr:hypothetical protein [Kofleriaceae bacterium]
MCVAETDPAFCTRLQATCDSMSALDNCGTMRTASCGTCGGANACVANACKAPVCGNLGFPTQSIATAVSDATRQDAVTGVTPDGKTVLNQRRQGSCGTPFLLLIADTIGVATTVTDLSSNPALASLRIANEGTLALTSDGLTIIGVTTAGTGFAASKRSALGTSDFAAVSASAFAALAVTPPRSLGFPAISSDSLAFYYTISGDPDPTRNGIYESVRASATAAFPAATRMPDAVQAFAYVTATSADRMTIFLQTQSFGMVVLSRNSLAQPFANPNAPNPPSTVPGFRTRPLGDCAALVGSCTAGGCPGEEICVFSR